MTDQSEHDRLDDVAPGDIISLDSTPEGFEPGHAPREYKVVHKDRKDATTLIVTLETDDGATSDVELPGDTVVHRSLESKWESAQSPTPHRGS